jgi:hypothetical protein
MVSCLVCKKSDKLHRFPKDESTLQKWMQMLNLRSRPSASDVICHRHFLPGDIIQTINGRYRIKPGAVPTINVKVNLDHTYSTEHKDPFSEILSLLMLLTPLLCCWLPLLIIFFCSLSDYNHHPHVGKLNPTFLFICYANLGGGVTFLVSYFNRFTMILITV